MASAAQIRKAIISSELSLEEITDIGDALAIKRRSVASRFIRTLEEGDRVEVTEVKPRYLQGCRGTVVRKVVSGKVEIRIDDKYDTRRYGHTLICPGSILRKIEEGA